MRQLASLIFAFSLRCCFQENLAASFILKCGSGQITVQWPNGTFKQCLHCAECHPGHGLYPHKCGDIVKFPAIIECKKCDRGKTFSDTYDTSRCKPCHLCAAHEVVTKKCTLSSDTKCKKACNSGYFFSKPQNVCKMCSHCCFDGLDEEQLQCINQGFTGVNRLCSPRPDRSCNSGSPTGSVISTVSLRSLLNHLNVKPVSQQLQYPKIALISSSPKHLDYEPASPQQDDKTIEMILGILGFLSLLASLLGLVRKYMPKESRTNRQDNAQNVEGSGWKRCESRPSNEGGLRLQAPRLQEVQQNEGFESAPASSTSQGSLTEIPHTGGFKESVPDVKVLPKDFRGQVPLRTEEKKADDSARVNILENKDVQDMSDTISGKGYRKLAEPFKSSL